MGKGCIFTSGSTMCTMKLSAVYVPIVAFFITSCSKSDTAVDNPSTPIIKVDSVQEKYLFTNETRVTGSVLNGTAVIQFNDNQVVKRAGAYVSYLDNGNFVSNYTTSLYDTVIYQSPNSLTMLQKTYDLRFTVPPLKREITLEDGLLKKKITYGLRADLPNDTVYYYYDNNKRIQRTEKYFLHDYVVRTYLFDASGNLTRVSSVRKGKVTGNVTAMEDEEFGGYDNKPNPLKRYFLWDDLYLRSLSANNFTTFKYTYVNVSANTPPEVYQLKWTLVYDSNGKVDYSK